MVAFISNLQHKYWHLIEIRFFGSVRTVGNPTNDLEGSSNGKEKKPDVPICLFNGRGGQERSDHHFNQIAPSGPLWIYERRTKSVTALDESVVPTFSLNLLISICQLRLSVNISYMKGRASKDIDTYWHLVDKVLISFTFRLIRHILIWFYF